jgi:hypothetical protein
MRVGLRIGLAIALCWLIASCSRESRPLAVYDLNGDGHADEWVYTYGKTGVKLALDSNFDGKPDLIETFQDGQLVEIDRDRNFDGKIDEVEQYRNGHLYMVATDDNYDGKPEVIDIYRRGKLAIAEYDPNATGAVQRADYYDDSGRLVRSVIRGKNDNHERLNDGLADLMRQD